MEGHGRDAGGGVGVEHAFPLERYGTASPWTRFGNDRPDTRFRHGAGGHHRHREEHGLQGVLERGESGGVVKAINARGAGDWSRGDVEKLADIAAENGAKGHNLDRVRPTRKAPSSIFFSDEEFAALEGGQDMDPGDLLLFAADTYEVASAVLKRAAPSI